MTMRHDAVVAVVALLALQGRLPAEVPRMTPEELRQVSTHIVVGQVLDVFASETRSEDWVHTKSVAQIAVLQVEKGSGILPGDNVYAHTWNRKWVGQGKPDPGSAGHSLAAKQDFVRAHLVRKSGSYHALLPNGLVRIEEPERAPADAHADLQGVWSFVYYEDLGDIQEPGSKQFVIRKDGLEFRAAGQTRVQTALEVDRTQRPGHFTQRFDDGQVYRSIYLRAGDYLILCGIRDGGRPKEFSRATDRGGGEFLIVLKRSGEA